MLQAIARDGDYISRQGERAAEQAAMALQSLYLAYASQTHAANDTRDTQIRAALKALFQQVENPSAYNAPKFAEAMRALSAGVALKLAILLVLLAVALPSARSSLPTRFARSWNTPRPRLVRSGVAIAVTNRQGDILALFRTPDAPDTAIGNFGASVDTNELAVALARTASFFSNNQAPLSSRTVRFISGVHFPPGISFTPNAALYGIENTNRGCGFNTTFVPGQEVPPARSIDGTQPGLGIQTGKADLTDSNPDAVNPGGVPLFRNGVVVGGVGVAGASAAVTEYAAFQRRHRRGIRPHSRGPRRDLHRRNRAAVRESNHGARWHRRRRCSGRLPDRTRLTVPGPRPTAIWSRLKTDPRCPRRTSGKSWIERSPPPIKPAR